MLPSQESTDICGPKVGNMHKYVDLLITLTGHLTNCGPSTTSYEKYRSRYDVGTRVKTQFLFMPATFFIDTIFLSFICFRPNFPTCLLHIFRLLLFWFFIVVFMICENIECL